MRLPSRLSSSSVTLLRRSLQQQTNLSEARKGNQSKLSSVVEWNLTQQKLATILRMHSVNMYSYPVFFVGSALSSISETMIFRRS